VACQYRLLIGEGLVCAEQQDCETPTQLTLRMRPAISKPIGELDHVEIRAAAIGAIEPGVRIVL
jgi:hypothetical protein